MKSLKLLVAFFALLAVALAEPPRRRPNNFRSFARQEGAPEESETPPPPAAEGYNYNPPPQSEQLRLPSRFTSQFKFGRQQQEDTTPSSASGGYHYPKPTDSYGTPDEQTNEPDGSYGTPDETTTPAPVDDDTTTDNPAAERLRGFNRKSAKFTRLQASQKLRSQPKIKSRLQLQSQQQQQQQQPQPIFYVVNTQPIAEFVHQPQLEYYYVLNK